MLLMPVMILLLLVLLLLLSLVRCTRIASSSSVVSVLICVTTATFFETGFSRSSFLTRKSRKPAADLPSLGNPRGILGFITLRRMATEECQLKLDGNCHAPRKFKNYCGNCFKKAPAIFSSDKIGTIQRRLAALYSSDTIETIQRRLATPYSFNRSPGFDGPRRQVEAAGAEKAPGTPLFYGRVLVAVQREGLLRLRRQRWAKLANLLLCPLQREVPRGTPHQHFGLVG